MMDDIGKVWVDCWQCGGEGYWYDCFDGMCENAEEGCDECGVRCDICRGKGGYDVPTDSEAARDVLRGPDQ